MADDSEDRSQAATGKKLQQARDEGNVPLSHDLAGLASLGVGLAVLIFAGPYGATRLMMQLRWYFLVAGNADLPAKQLLVHAAMLMAVIVGPMVLAVMSAGLVATWMQTGFLFHLGAIGLDLTRLSPSRGFARIFSINHLVDLLKSVVRILVLGYAVGRCLVAEWPLMRGALNWTPAAVLSRLMQDLSRIVMAMLLAQSVIVAADYLWVRLKHMRDMRMSREDVKQEHKDADGDPHIKAKRKRIRYVRARQRMMAAVPRATVVITNPTHYAIALSYERGKQAAPRVVAKGADEVAAKIREIAEDNRVPLVRNPPLARALYLVELDAEIPAEHFQAVAEIIAYVWRLKTAFRSGGL